MASENDLERLKRRIAEKKSELLGTNVQPKRRTLAASERVIFLFSELIAGFAVGFFLGWWIDKSLGTKPWFTLLFLVLGCAASILTLFRQSKNWKK